MLVDWKIGKDGDSGIYLRGTPQVQIWDPASKVAAGVGSGGLYNNKKGAVAADQGRRPSRSASGTPSGSRWSATRSG